MKRERRISKLKLLIVRLESGDNVSQGDMKRALSECAYDNYLRLWGDEKSARTCKKPDKIRRYQELLTKACIAYHKLDTYSGKRNPKLPVLEKQRIQVDRTFHAALEFIQEAVSIESNLRTWLDRDPFDEGVLSPDRTSIPRVIGSKSHECRSKWSTPYPTFNKRGIKLWALSKALEDLVGSEDSDIPVPHSSLREKLTALEGVFV